MTELPDGWVWVTLEDAMSECRNGLTYRNNPELAGFPVSRIETISKGEIDFEKVGYGGLELKGNEKHLLNAGDILFSHINSMLHVGKVAIYKSGMPELLHGMNLLRITPNGDFMPEFLFHVFQSNDVRRQIWLKAKHAVNQASINIRELKTVVIPKPPIKEQQKIVELLEDHLSRLDGALSDVRSAQSKSSQLKLAVLSKVFAGEFFEFEMPILSIEEVAKVMNGDRGKNYPNKSARVESGVAFINAGHLDNDLLNIEDMDFISEERFNLLAAGKVELDDLLFCLRGSLGKVAINDKFIKGAIASSLAILRVNDKVLPKYLYFYFLSPQAAAEIKKHDNGTAQPNLSAANLRQFEVPIPTIEQQKNIIDFLDSELSRTIQASQTFDSLLLMAATLRRSLLQSAFTGQLAKEVVSV